jgi:indole-3-glycerol phosphate synthase
MNDEMNDTPDILRRILARKAEEIAERTRDLPLDELRSRIESAPVVRPFRATLERRIAAGDTGVIAEIKKASPSKGVLRESFDPVAIARRYEAGGAACLSVLTDRDFFQGGEDYLVAAREACGLPVLRKDFTIDPYQVYEARAIGADAVLLIVAALDDTTLRELYQLARELDMDALVEVHGDEELDRALALGADLVGINNRDLRTFKTRLKTTLDLMERFPRDCRLVTESGIHTREEVERLKDKGVKAYLVGEAFMRAPDPGAALRDLFGSG